jgi:hypothetical protein
MSLVFLMQDSFEILFLSSIIYIFSLWLKHDKRHNLLAYFYLYCTLLCITSIIGLSVLSIFLFYISPYIAIFFIIFHQDILQKNFISMRNKPSSFTEQNSDWLEHLMRATLQSINNNRSIVCIIQNQTNLEFFLDVPFIFNSPLHQNTISLLMESNTFDQHKMIWCTTTGILVGINATYKLENNTILEHEKKIPLWQQNALLMTLKTDTIIFKADASKRLFDIVIKGTLFENLSASHALALIQKHITPKTISVSTDVTKPVETRSILS